MTFHTIITFVFRNKIVKHILFWLSYGLLTISQSGMIEEKDIILESTIFGMLLPIKMLFTYFVIYFLFPRLMLTGKIFGFLVSVLAVMPFAIISQRAAAHFLVYPIVHPEGTKYGFLCSSCLVFGFFVFFFLFGYACSLKMFKHWYLDQKAAQKLQQEKLEAELKFLKAQIHPHFLFNTLNNLYALALKKSDKAPEMVLKLSDLLNYMLYECNADRVSLKKELELIDNYLELEKLRYGKNIQIEFIKNGNFNGLTIAPMLILPFIENAFKHGLSEKLDSSFVKIIASVNEENFNFQVINSNSASAKNRVSDGYKEGIGLKNVKRRLELQYKDDYVLLINDEPESFTVNLSLKTKA